MRTIDPRYRTLAIIPAFNEEQGLPAVLDDLGRHCPGLDILVVDDGSRDATAETAYLHGVSVARLAFNLGIGGALRTGFRYAVDNGYDRAIQFDADGQHDAREVSKLLDRLDTGADMVVGSRFGEPTATYKVGRLRWHAMRTMRFVVQILSGQRLHDPSSGFRAFSRPSMELFARSYPVEYMDSVEALLLACYAGFRVVEVPVLMHERAIGVPSNRNYKLVYHYIRLMIVMLSTASRRGRRRKLEELT